MTPLKILGIRIPPCLDFSEMYSYRTPNYIFIMFSPARQSVCTGYPYYAAVVCPRSWNCPDTEDLTVIERSDILLTYLLRKNK